MPIFDLNFTDRYCSHWTVANAVREIVANAVVNGGFPPLLLDPIDFVALYQQKMASLQGQQAPPAAPPQT